MKKAISPIISIIIILLITVAIAGAGFSYISVYWTGLMSKQIEILPPYCSNNRAAITLRNIGTSGINNSDHEAMLGLFEQDENTVGMWRFDETDGNASLDSSGQGNTGTIFGNTVLLMHFDEDDGNATLDSTSYGNTGTLYGDTVLLMHFDNGSGATANDETSYGNEGTLQGDLETSGWKSEGCQSDKCLEFDGSGDYVEVEADDSLNPGYGSWTVSGWVKVLDLSYPKSLFPVGGYGGAGVAFWGIGLDNSNTGIWVGFSDGATRVSSILSCDSGYRPIDVKDSWAHITIVFNRGDGKIYAFVNGVKQSNTVDISSVTGHVNNTHNRISNVAGWFFNGTLDEAAIYSRALTGDEINASYQAGRAKFIERKPGRSGNAIEFGGTRDYVSKSAPSYGTRFSDGSFSISYWFKANSFVNSTGTQIRPFEIATCSGGAYMTSIIAVTTNPTSNINLYASDSDSVVESTSSAANSISTNTWHLYTAVMDRGNNEGRLYIDGNQSGSTNALSWTGEFNCTSATIYFGGFGAGSSFNGTIDEAAIYSRTLTEDEIKTHYEAGRAKFIEHVPGRYGNAMEFDGDGDYVDVPLALGNNTWSIGLWAKSNDNSPTGHGTRCFGGCTPRLYLMGSAMSYGSGTYGEATLNVNTGISDYNTWNHWVYQFNGSSIKIFVNGELRGNKSRSAENLVSPIYFGRGPNYYFNGTIDEVLIFNRSLSAEEIQAQVKPACSCTGNTCQCGELTVIRTSGQGYFHPYFDNGTFSPGQSLTMTDYNCLGGRCEYRITLPAGSYDATAVCG